MVDKEFADAPIRSSVGGVVMDMDGFAAVEIDLSGPLNVKKKRSTRSLSQAIVVGLIFENLFIFDVFPIVIRHDTVVGVSADNLFPFKLGRE